MRPATTSRVLGRTMLRCLFRQACSSCGLGRRGPDAPVRTSCTSTRQLRDLEQRRLGFPCRTGQVLMSPPHSPCFCKSAMTLGSGIFFDRDVLHVKALRQTSREDSHVLLRSGEGNGQASHDHTIHRNGGRGTKGTPGLPCQGCTQPPRSELRMLENWEVFWHVCVLRRHNGTLVEEKKHRPSRSGHFTGSCFGSIAQLRELEPKSSSRDRAAPMTTNTHHIYAEHSQTESHWW